MPLQRKPDRQFDELTVSRFTVSVGGLTVASFLECSGLSGTVGVERYEEGGLNDYVHVLPGRTSWGEVTLKTGVANGTDLWQWFSEAAMNRVQRYNVSIIANSQTNAEVFRWNLYGAFPSKWEGPSFTAGTAEALVQSLTLTYSSLLDMRNTST